MRQKPFSTKLYTVMAVLLSASVVVGIIGVTGLARTNAGLETVYSHRVVPLQQLKQIADAYAVAVIDAANKANAGLFTADEASKAVEGARDVINRNWAAYKALPLSPEEARLASEADALFRPADAAMARLTARLAAQQGSVAGTFDDFDGPLYATIDPISNKISELIELQLRVAGQEYSSAQQRYATVRALAIASVLMAFFVGGAYGWLVIRDVSRTLRLVTGQLRDGAVNVVSTASHVSASAQSLSQGATEQAAALEETSASMEEMSSMTRGNAEHSQAAAGLMTDVDQWVQQSQHSLQDMVASMAAIEDSSQQVSRIIRTIDEIAFQTNILALNAAVEAARAAEAGLGFAVVAEEVRALAHRSAQAARDTAGLIEASISRAQSGAARVGQVTTAINGITASVSRVKSLVEDVSAASHQQAQGFDQVSQAIVQMERVKQTTAATAEESAAASEELNAQAATSMCLVAQLVALVDGGGAASPPQPVAAMSHGDDSRLSRRRAA